MTASRVTMSLAQAISDDAGASRQGLFGRVEAHFGQGEESMDVCDGVSSFPHRIALPLTQSLAVALGRATGADPPPPAAWSERADRAVAAIRDAALKALGALMTTEPGGSEAEQSPVQGAVFSCLLIVAGTGRDAMAAVVEGVSRLEGSQRGGEAAEGSDLRSRLLARLWTHLAWSDRWEVLDEQTSLACSTGPVSRR
jgi:hypothetical protein